MYNNKGITITKKTKTMSTKKEMMMEMSEMMMVIKHFNNNNEVVINRYNNVFGMSFQDVVDTFNLMVDTYNQKYGKRFGCCKKYSK